jgi:putative exporter of polyketide antibiotics
MILLFVQKLMLAVFIGAAGLCLFNDERNNWNQESLKEMLKSRHILLKLLSFLTGLAVLTGIILVPFAKTWTWFIIGSISYVLGLISQGVIFDFSRLAWINKKCRKS